MESLCRRFAGVTLFTGFACFILTFAHCRTVCAQLVSDGVTNTLSNVTTNIPGNVTVGTNGSFTSLVSSDDAATIPIQ